VIKTETEVAFRRSSACATDACVEVDVGAELVVVKSTRGDTRLTFSPGEWAAFIQGVKAGEFDVPR